jgi:membrane protein
MKILMKALWRAFYNLFNDLSIDISGYIAYTTLLAIFPFLMLLVSLAGYVGTTEAVQAALQQFYSILPSQVTTAISPVITEVTNTTPSGFLTVLIVVILWISSSSIEAIRRGLNHSYNVEEKRSIIQRRAQAILFVVIGSATFLLASFVLIVLPVGLEIWQHLEVYIEKLPNLPERLGVKIDILRLIGAYGAILITMVTMYRWLPYHKIKISHCLPGALVSSALWIMMAGLFSLYLQNFARYDVLYGSLGGIVVTLIFFHITAILILYGAHVNRVLWTEG